MIQKLLGPFERVLRSKEIVHILIFKTKRLLSSAQNERLFCCVPRLAVEIWNNDLFYHWNWLSNYINSIKISRQSDANYSLEFYC